MTMRNQGLVKAFQSNAAMTRARIVRLIDDRTAAQAAGPTEALVGVLDSSANVPAAGRSADVILTGVATVEYGGTVTAGAFLTSDAQGRAVVAVPGAGVNNRVLGVAMVAGVLGDLGAVSISQGSVQG